MSSSVAAVVVATPQLAEQNARLMESVDKLRLRSHMLMWAVPALED